MPLAKVSDLRVRLGIGASDTSQDTKLTAALEAATRMIEEFCGRTLLYAAADRVEQYDGDGFEVLLDDWPITTLVSVKEASDYDFASATALVANEDYLAIPDRGRLIRLPNGARWEPGPRTVQVTFRAGYADPSGAAIGGVDFVPDNIQQACLLQAAEMWRRMDEPGYKVVFGGGGGAAGVSGGFAPQTELLKAAADLLQGEYRL